MIPTSLEQELSHSLSHELPLRVPLRLRGRISKQFLKSCTRLMSDYGLRRSSKMPYYPNFFLEQTLPTPAHPPHQTENQHRPFLYELKDLQYPQLPRMSLSFPTVQL